MDKQLDNEVAKRLDVAEALKLRLKGWTFQAIGEKYGLTRQAVQRRIKRFKRILLEPGELEAFKNHEGDLLRAVDLRLLRAIVDKVDDCKTTLGHLAFAKDKVFTHRRLLEGESTQNVAALTKIILEAHQRSTEPQAQAEQGTQADDRQGKNSHDEERS